MCLCSCSLDYLSVSSIMDSGRVINMGDLCGQNIPGPIVSEQDAKSMRFVFRSNADKDVHSGFRAMYEFYRQSVASSKLGK